jgi:subtilisin family serine protease
VLASRVFRYRIIDGRAVSTVIAALERDPRVVSAQPNYRYALAQAAPAVQATPAVPAAPAQQAAAVEGSRPDLYATQYSAGKLQLREAHAIGKGERVLVAVIDSGIDAAHPEMNGAIAKQIDIVEEKDRVPHAHGTAMAGAIVARSQLMGVAPAARLLAIKAFASTSSAKGSGTTFNLTRAIDRAVEEGARVINLSFAGPADPMLQRSLQAARRRGIVLVASVGNEGPNAAPLYPAADPNVIAVTATDANDRLFAGANRGSYVVVAAPGVDVLVPAPHAEYGLSTGTSVAAAHVSGVVALLLARKPNLDPDAIRALLKSSARALAGDPDNGGGAGIANAYEAIVAADAAPAAASGIVTH